MRTHVFIHRPHKPPRQKKGVGGGRIKPQEVEKEKKTIALLMENGKSYFGDSPPLYSDQTNTAGNFPGFKYEFESLHSSPPQ